MEVGQVDYFKDTEKFVVCLLASIAAVVAGVFVATDSRFYAHYYVSTGMYEISAGPGVFVCLAGFLLLALGFIVLSGCARRGKKVLALKEDARKQDFTRRGFVSVNDMSNKDKIYSNYAKKAAGLKKVGVAVIVVGLLCFVFCFFVYDLGYLLDELGKAEIDRTSGDFRVFADIIGKALAYIGIGISSVFCVKIMCNKPIKRGIMYAAIGCLSVAAVQLAYFFVGDIWVFPCVADLGVVVLECLLVTLCVLSVVTEKIKATLKSFGNDVEGEY